MPCITELQSSSAYTSLAAGCAGCYPLALRLGASRHGSLYFPYVGLYIKTKIPCMKHRVREMNSSIESMTYDHVFLCMKLPILGYPMKSMT